MADPVFVDGTTPLNAANMNKLQTRDEKAAVNGYASLGSDGKVPTAQLPTITSGVDWSDVGTGTTSLPPLSYGTTLPASPVGGQEAILVDSTTNPTWQWRFRYNALSTSPYKWEFIGGSPKVANAVALQSAGSTGWVVLPSSPQFVVPYSGDYRVRGGGRFNASVVSYGTIGAANLAAATAGIAPYASAYLGAGEVMSAFFETFIQGMTAGQTISIVVSVNLTSLALDNISMVVEPRRVG